MQAGGDHVSPTVRVAHSGTCRDHSTCSSIPWEGCIMRIRLLTAAALAAMVLLLPNRSQAQPSRPPGARPAAAYHVVDRLLTHRGALALTEHQVHELTTL